MINSSLACKIKREKSFFFDGSADWNGEKADRSKISPLSSPQKNSASPRKTKVFREGNNRMDGAQTARGLFFCLFSLVVLLRLVEVGEGGGGGGGEGAEGPGEEQEIAILVRERNSGRKEKMKGYINKN